MTDFLGPRCPLLDPGTQQPDLFSREQLAFLRHHSLRVRPRRQTDEQAVSAFAGNYRRPAFAPFQGGGFSIQSQAVPLPGRAMTLVAALFEYWLNLPFKIDHFCSGRRQLYGMQLEEKQQ